MTELEIRQQIRDKEVEIDILNDNIIKFKANLRRAILILLFAIAVLAAMIVIGIIPDIQKYIVDFTQFAYIICVIFISLGVILSVFYLISVINKYKQSPVKIESLKTEVSGLRMKLENKETTPSKSNSNIDVNSEIANIALLVKYKKLLEDGTITKEEYDKKKEEILK